MAGLNGLVEHRLRQSIDLDDEEATLRMVRRPSETGPAGDTVDHPLELQDGVIDHRGAILARGARLRSDRHQGRVSPGLGIHTTSGSSLLRATSAAIRAGGSS